MKKNQENLDLKIFWSPAINKEPFRGRAISVSSKNKMGQFDILFGHISFITLIFEDISIHTVQGERITYDFKRGVLEISENKVNVFLGL